MRHDLSILQLRYTKAQFAASNPTPSSGQLCIETDSGVYTTGDGSSAYLTIRGNSDLSGLDRTSADDVYAMMSLGDSRDEVGDGSAEMIPFVIINSGDIKAAYRYYDISLTKPRYVQVIPGTTQAASAAASNFLFWGGDDKWHGWGNGGGEYFTSEDDVATPDLVTTWVLASGAVAPLPTVEPYYGTQQDLDEVLAQQKGPLVYAGFASQSGTDNPTVTVLRNNLNGTPVWTRNGEGGSLATLAGAFPQTRTVVHVTARASPGEAQFVFNAEPTGNSVGISMVAWDGTAYDGWEINFRFEIY